MSYNELSLDILPVFRIPDNDAEMVLAFFLSFFALFLFCDFSSKNPRTMTVKKKFLTVKDAGFSQRQNSNHFFVTSIQIRRTNQQIPVFLLAINLLELQSENIKHRTGRFRKNLQQKFSLMVLEKR
jgi:hypothetical protein